MTTDLAVEHYAHARKHAYFSKSDMNSFLHEISTQEDFLHRILQHFKEFFKTFTFGGLEIFIHTIVKHESTGVLSITKYTHGDPPVSVSM
jgi:hypothetical protein